LWNTFASFLFPSVENIACIRCSPSPHTAYVSTRNFVVVWYSSFLSLSFHSHPRIRHLFGW
jgi:hypothetical protein